MLRAVLNGLITYDALNNTRAAIKINDIFCGKFHIFSLSSSIQTSRTVGLLLIARVQTTFFQ
jgi:hypothetical protein